MGIEQLTKAAEAAGYAMATEDGVGELAPAKTEAPPAAMIAALFQPNSTGASQMSAWVRAYAVTATGWVRGHLSGFGRAPA